MGQAASADRVAPTVKRSLDVASLVQLVRQHHASKSASSSKTTSETGDDFWRFFPIADFSLVACAGFIGCFTLT